MKDEDAEAALLGLPAELCEVRGEAEELALCDADRDADGERVPQGDADPPPPTRCAPAESVGDAVPRRPEADGVKEADGESESHPEKVGVEADDGDALGELCALGELMLPPRETLAKPLRDAAAEAVCARQREGVGDAECVVETLLEPLVVDEAEAEPLSDADTETLGVAELRSVPVEHAESEARDAEADTEAVGSASVPVRHAETEGEGEGDSWRLALALPVRERAAEKEALAAVGLPLGLPLGLLPAEGEGAEDQLTVAVRVVALTVEDPTGVGVDMGGDCEALKEAEVDALRERLPDAVAEGEPVGELLLVPRAPAEREGSGEALDDAVASEVTVGEGALGDEEALALGVALLATELVPDFDARGLAEEEAVPAPLTVAECDTLPS